jgi:predicted nucleic acid-binding Zn ribbon protein
MKGDPVPISASLDAVLRALRPEPPRSSDRSTSAHTARQLGSVFGRWVDVVGPAVAEHVTPIKLDGSKLVVEVDDPGWATQLRFLEAALVQRLGEVTGAIIDTIEVRVIRH